jgi:hypothetical protein
MTGAVGEGLEEKGKRHLSLRAVSGRLVRCMNQQDFSAVKPQHDVSGMMMIKTVMPRNVSYYLVFFFEPD